VSTHTIKPFSEMEAIYGGAFVRARASLGASAFGLQLLRMPPDSGEFYPDHDHSHDGQEEVYVVLSGGAVFTIDGAATTVGPEVAVRVAPEARRHLAPGPEGAVVLVIGGRPGHPYEAPEMSQLGAPDPSVA
jgi:mannose-6-phosphate isomerase-like protein (cupin superfamily)